MAGLLLRKRCLKDHKRRSFPLSFGTTTNLVDCEFDLNLSNFNQDNPNGVTGDPALPEACTAFLRADMATNEDRIIYDPQFTYDKACFEQNVPVGSPLPLQAVFDSARVDGLKAVGEPEGNELNHRRGPYAEVHPVNGQDWFDAIWSALLTGGRPIGVGTVWFPEMTNPVNGIVDSVKIRPTTDGHAYEICGVKTTDAPRMHIKAWTGIEYYFGRSAINSLMNATGSDCLLDVDGKATLADLKNVGFVYTLRTMLLSFLQRLFVLESGSTEPIFTVWDEMEEEVQIIQEEITQLVMHEQFPEKIVKWAQAITHGEGASPSSNNPGNLKYSSLTASWGGTKGRPATDGGYLCQFSTLPEGQDALCNFLKLGAEDLLVAFHQARTLQAFTMVYAGNPPQGYIDVIGEMLGVPLDTNVSTFLS